MENEETLAQLRHDAGVLREKIDELKGRRISSRPFSSREWRILEDMLEDVEAEIRRIEKRNEANLHKEMRDSHESEDLF